MIAKSAAVARRWGIAALVVICGTVVALLLLDYGGDALPTGDGVIPPSKGGSGKMAEEQTDGYAAARNSMVDRQLRGRDVDDERVLSAMANVPRHEFVPANLVDLAYSDGPLPIGLDQTISQPYIVALMSQLARTRPDSRALDIGTGSGYQAAVLSELCAEVYSIEILEPLAARAKKRLADLGYSNVEVRCGDGYRGWPEKAPFDVIIVAAAPQKIPPPLIEQLAPGGRLVIPVGKYSQKLIVVEKQGDGEIVKWNVVPVAFVPMTGEATSR